VIKPGKTPIALRVGFDDGAGFDLTEAGTKKSLAVYAVRSPDEVPGIARLGPDPLSPGFDRAAFGALLEGRRTHFTHAALGTWALSEGSIDAISSDHSPFAPYEVQTTFDEAPAGMAGLESCLAACLTHLTQKGVLTPLETIRRLSTAPAEIMRLDAGTLQPGGSPVAQVTLIDPNLEWTFDVGRTISKGKNSPFHGTAMQGKAVWTYCGSEVYRDSRFDDQRQQ
jgi:hypothetical protein